MPIWNNRSVDRFYPLGPIRERADVHWTPYKIAKLSANFLSETPNAKILDIGSGVGKFSIIGAKFNPQATFFGIEQRQHFVEAGNSVIDKVKLSNVKLMHGNFMNMDLSSYTGLYFFNSFYENFHYATPAADDNIERSDELFDRYTEHLINGLCEMPIDTRLVTYYSGGIVPASYESVKSYYGGRLKFWIKREEGNKPHVNYQKNVCISFKQHTGI